MTPIEALTWRARRQPAAVAFVAGDDVWSYRRLSDEVERLAAAFHARGLGAGDRVVLRMANLPTLVVAYYACFRIGAIACALSPTFRDAELEPLLQQLRPALHLGEAGPWDELFVDGGDRSLPPYPDIDAAAALLTTSGTTGAPKFVAHTPKTLAAIGHSFLHLGLDGEQVAVNAVPMMHVGGLATLLGCIHFGRPMILFERFDPEAVLDAIEPHRCSWLIGVPRMYAALVESQRRRRRQVGTLRTCLVAGDVCPMQLHHDFSEVFGVPLRSFWGSTETFGTFTYGLQDGPVSCPAPGTCYRLEAGELVVRGPSVTIGYWSAPDRIDPPSGGWFHTGDLMREREPGELWFVARKKDLIVRGGSNISPIEVENVLKAHAAVSDAAVVGIPDSVLGQRVMGLVVLRENAEERVLDDILAHARERLADFKVPERLVVVDEIPRNALGKVDRLKAAEASGCRLLR